MRHPSHHARLTPDKIAYRMDASGEEMTFRELDERSNQGAQALRSLGVGPGDHIALLMENRLEFLEICWAAQRSGVVYTAISRYLKPDEAAYIVRDCGAKVFITSDKYADMAAELRAAIGEGPRMMMVGGTAEGFESWEGLRASMPAEPVADECFGEDMLYSSGTTGRPKGIARRFEVKPIGDVNPLLLLLVEKLGGLTSDGVYLSPAPLYHAAPLRFSMTAAALGATVVVMERFDPEGYLAAVQRHGATHTQVVPTMFVRLLKLPGEVRASYDVSSLRSVVHAAAPCPVDIKRAMIDWVGPILIEYYAGTEGNGATVATSAEWLAHPGTVGRSMVGEVRIIGPDGEEVPRGEIGDVYFESGLDFIYHNDDGKTAGSFLRPGCSTLGDVGYLDEDGFLHLTDRAAYTIISGGVNIYPQETEDLLVTHPAVADAAVFGVPDEDLGEAVKAVVQPLDPSRAGPELEAELIAHCRAHLSALKAPRSIDFREELPRTATGKLLKRHLKAEYWPKPVTQGASA